MDRRLPDGNWIIGTPRPWTPVKTTEADKRYLRGFRGAGTAPDSLVRPMVETKGPFSDAVASADGEVWLRTHQPAGYTTERYAVFPVSGPSTRTVVMKRDESVVGITESWVYSTLEDESGLYTLRRYRRPEGGPDRKGPIEVRRDPAARCCRAWLQQCRKDRAGGR